MKIAVIGMGSISQTHLSAIETDRLGEVTAVCDVREDRLAAAKQRVPAAIAYQDYRALLAAQCADVVHICTPHYLHAEMTIAALEKGYNVYLEKPAAMTYEQGETILHASRRTGKRVCVSFQNRLINCNARAKQILTSGQLGGMKGLKGIVTWHREGKYYTDSGWRGTWDKEGGGVLMNQSIHTLDLLYYFGGRVRSVEGSVDLRKNRGTIEVEDTAEATLYFENGATGIFYATTCHAIDSPVEIEIVCEKGTLLIRDDVLYRVRDGVAEPEAKNDRLAEGKACWGDGHRRMIGSFYRAMESGGTAQNSEYCDIEDGIEVLKLIEGIYRSSAVKLR